MNKRYPQENYEHICRYIEDLDEIRERSHIVHDEITSTINRRLNKNMYILSAIMVIFMPLTFITGLFGMNVGGIPLNENRFGFYLVSIILLCLIVIQIIWSKKNKWF